MGKKIVMRSVLSMGNSPIADHDEKYVSSISPNPELISQIEAEKGERVLSYQFFVVQTLIDEQDGREVKEKYLYKGPQIYRGQTITMGEVVFCHGKDNTPVNINGKAIERVCIVGPGLMMPMNCEDVTEEEYIELLTRHPEVIEKLEAGVEPVPSPIHK